MIVGAHAILYSKDAEADRAFLRDVLKLPSADAGEGWLIFGLPPSEIAIHPGERSGKQELYLLCDDADKFVAAMRARGLDCGAVADVGWGRLTELTLPGGGAIGVYEPRHARPTSAAPRAKPKKKAKARTTTRLARAKNPMPANVKKALESRGLMKAYKARPPYQQNDWLGWIARAKQPSTRAKRLDSMLRELKAGRGYMGMKWEPRT